MWDKGGIETPAYVNKLETFPVFISVLCMTLRQYPVINCVRIHGHWNGLILFQDIHLAGE